MGLISLEIQIDSQCVSTWNRVVGQIDALAQIIARTGSSAVGTCFRIGSTPVFRKYINLLHRSIQTGRFEQLVYRWYRIANCDILDREIRGIG